MADRHFSADHRSLQKDPKNQQQIEVKNALTQISIHGENSNKTFMYGPKIPLKCHFFTIWGFSHLKKIKIVAPFSTKVRCIVVVPRAGICGGEQKHVCMHIKMALECNFSSFKQGKILKIYWFSDIHVFDVFILSSHFLEKDLHFALEN